MKDGMTDPAKENITGEKVERHEFQHNVRHKVNWGHVALGVGALALAYVLAKRWQDAEDDEENVDGSSLT